MDENENMPAWIMAQDLLTKLKYEFANREISLLYDEIKAGRVDFKGALVTDPDKSNENEKYAFMISHLIEERSKIHEMYDSYLKDADNINDPNLLSRVEGLKKFILAVDSIAVLEDYKKEMDDWILDASLSITDSNPSDIIYNTLLNSPKRQEIAEFSITNPYFKNEVLSKDEYALIKNAYDKAKSTDNS